MEYIKGACAGIFGIIISHPFDTIKSNIQNNIYIKKYNLKILYKGLLPPLIGTSIEKSIVFGTYNHLQKLNNNTLINGFIAGFIASFIITPYERLKIIKQNNVQNFKVNIRTLYSGFSMCIMRDSPGFAIYFTNYEFLKSYFYTKKDRQITKIGSFLIGGSSGLVAWIFIYPQDKIKTIMQSSTRKIGVYNNICIIYNSGIKNFYKGFSYALMRAIPLHAGTFMMYDILDQYY
jgi:hypothetical protein